MRRRTVSDAALATSRYASGVRARIRQSLPGPRRRAGGGIHLTAAIRAACLVAALITAPSPLPAQGAAAPVYVRTDLLVASKYVWRGVTRSEYPTLQAHGAVALRGGALRLAGGAFASLEPFGADADEHTLIGVGERGIGEADYWGEVSVELGEVEVASGLLRYTFHGDDALGGRSSVVNTTELFARFDARGVSFSPSLAAWVDLEDVRGTYVELRAAAPLLGWPFQPPGFVTVDLELGLSLGQALDPAAGQRANFAGNGPTHLQLGVSALKRVGPWIDLSIGLRGQLGFDDSVRVGADGYQRRLKGWITVGTVIRPIPRREHR
ncbi:MAG TPA: hypothetical protein VFM14_09395 [Gemmatimonadales bacterium]|nr:hypothetical protein [Gemmatimonadales bacterium]